MSRFPVSADVKHALALGWAVALSAVAVGASADAGDKAAALALFEQAKDLMAQGRPSEACPKFAESQRLDSGLGTMLRLADCYAANGQTASAWAQFSEAADLAAKQHDPREKVARKHMAQLQAVLPKLVIAMPGTGQDEVEVRRDGIVVPKAVWGTEIPVDPGSHSIVASAPGKQTWTRSVDVPAGAGAQTVAVPALDADPHATAAPVPWAVGVVPPPGAEAAPSRGGLQRTLGIVAAGVGVVGVGVGSVFGVMAKSSLDSSNANGHCLPNDHCDPTGIKLRSDFTSEATVSTVAFVAGLAAVGCGAVLFFTAPKGHAAPSVAIVPSVGPKGGGAMFRADW